MADVRGRIQYRDRKRQIITFENVRYGNITPTDIDGALDFRGDIFAFIEVKYGNTEMKDGQRMFLQNVVDGLYDGGREAAAFVVYHNVSDPNEDIDVAECMVHKIYMRGKWIESKERKPLKEQLDVFFSFAEEHRKERERTRSVAKAATQFANSLVKILGK